MDGIARKMSVEPTEVNIGSGLRWLALAGAPIAAVSAALVSGFGPGLTALIGLCGLVVGHACYVIWAPSLLSGRIGEVENGILTPARAALVAAAGGQPAHIDVVTVMHDGPGRLISASGLATADGGIALMEHGETAVVPWSAVRSWDWSVIEPDQFYVAGGSLGSRLMAIEANRAARSNANTNSGFTVRVADIGKPVWHIETSDRSLLERWQEIFDQVSEGQLDRAAQTQLPSP